ncbi:hypothetical protein JQ575_27185 [Bradyrhizobium sp. JYMT SZCCT0428]|nr:hypothetical protein [Bradyrhizobium sp. JYMT SZCCT0428]
MGATGCAGVSVIAPSSATTCRFEDNEVALLRLSAGSAIIDGEVVVPAADGTTDFSVLQNELKGKSTRIVLVAFDLLYLNGYDLRKLPLMERKAHLRGLIAATDVQREFATDGREIYAHACKVGLEGVVSKEGNDLLYAGKVDHGFDKTSAAELRRRLTPLTGTHFSKGCGKTSSPCTQERFAAVSV